MTRACSPALAPAEVLAFWFGDKPYGPDTLTQRSALWFDGASVFDREITSRFGVHIERAGAGEYDDFRTTPRGTLALILLLDQFPRHVYRNQRKAFQYDARAREICQAGLGRGFDRALHVLERQFFYLPLQHAESFADQEQCVSLFAELLREEPADGWLGPLLRQALEIARFHQEIIRRYGRYPHRNAALGRTCTMAERMYLDAGGPTFGQGDEPPLRESAARRREFRIYTPALPAADTVCVDGNVFGLRTVSHWPGSSAPPELDHELSTGMALVYAGLAESERQRVLGQFSIVTNDHYDTDGVLSAFALIAPEQALAHAELMLRTAATGDFRTWQGEAALALDLTVWALRGSERSPLASALAQLPSESLRDELCYRWLLEHLQSLLASPHALRGLWEKRFEQVVNDIRAVESGREVGVQELPREDLAVIFTNRPLTRHGLVHASGERSRVLLVQPSASGWHYRFVYRNESWFVGVRDRTAPRVSLERVTAKLNQLEGAPHGHWWCMPLDQTSPELGFGFEAAAPTVFGDLRPDLDPPSSLTPRQVIELLSEVLRLPPSHRSCPQPIGPSELS